MDKIKVKIIRWLSSSIDFQKLSDEHVTHINDTLIITRRKITDEKRNRMSK